MTSAMLPTQPVSSSPGSTSKGAPKNDSAQEFADTLRGQFDNDVEATAPEQTSVNTSQSNPAPEQDVDLAMVEVATPAAEIARALLASQELNVSAMHARTMLPEEDVTELVELVDSVQLVMDAVSVIDPQALAAELADSATAAVVVAAPLTAPAVAASKPTARIAQVGTTLDTASETDDLRAAPTLPPIRATVEGMSPATVHDSKDGAQKELFALNFTRLSEAAAPINVQTSPTVTPVFDANPTVMQNTVQLPAAASPMQFSVDTPLGNPSWGMAIGARLAWVATQGIESARIEINPRELGPVSVSLTMADDEVSVSFVSQHALVREAIEAALPRLRELFSGEGISLGDVNISNGEGRANDGEDSAADGDAQSHSNAAVASQLPEARGRLLDSLVDTFA
ncbi:MAG: flagellar hook-length control protein FliK [Gammaproteobacteria bacterium]|jgi:flagellar hook-length control protein FliK